MATQILYAEEVGNELIFGELKDTVNMTEFLDEVAGSLFKEKKYYEDEEEISYRVVEYRQMERLVDTIRSFEETIFDELTNVRGNEKKVELVEKLRDLSLLNKTVFNALLQSCQNDAKIVALL